MGYPVNNAGFQMTRAGILEMPPEEIERVFRTNVYAMFYHYAASKAAIANFTKGLSQELAGRGIRATGGQLLP